MGRRKECTRLNAQQKIRKIFVETLRSVLSYIQLLTASLPLVQHLYRLLYVIRLGMIPGFHCQLVVMYITPTIL